MRVIFKSTVFGIFIITTVTGCSTGLGNFSSNQERQLSKNQFPGVAVEGSRVLSKALTVKNRVQLAENLRKKSV